jgi:hypothetical protein
MSGDHTTVMRRLSEHRARLMMELATIETDNSYNLFRGEYFPNPYDCSTARARAQDSLLRDLERCDDDIARLDDEMAVAEYGGETASDDYCMVCHFELDPSEGDTSICASCAIERQQARVA